MIGNFYVLIRAASHGEYHYLRAADGAMVELDPLVYHVIHGRPFLSRSIVSARMPSDTKGVRWDEVIDDCCSALRAMGAPSADVTKRCTESAKVRVRYDPDQRGGVLT